MSIRCRNGTEHTHETVEESRACWAEKVPSLAAPVPASAPPAAPTFPSHYDPATEAQIRYVGILLGDEEMARRMTKGECSNYIDRLKRERASGRSLARGRAAVSTFSGPTTVESDPDTDDSLPEPPPVTGATNKSKVPMMLLDGVPEGRYAVRVEEGSPWTFLRLSRPNRGRYKGTTKVQTQHGPNYDLAWVAWPSGRISVYKYTVEEAILLTIANYREAARQYGRELGRCSRCGLELTDERSRHYSIGPECEKYWPWMIEQVDEEYGYSFGHKPRDW